MTNDEYAAYPEPDPEPDPEPTPGVCEWVEYHDDMYPEFAPEPIVVTCDKPSEVTVDDGEEATGFCMEHGTRAMMLAIGEGLSLTVSPYTPPPTREEREDGECWMAEQRAGNYHGRNVL